MKKKRAKKQKLDPRRLEIAARVLVEIVGRTMDHEDAASHALAYADALLAKVSQ